MLPVTPPAAVMTVTTLGTWQPIIPIFETINASELARIFYKEVVYRDNTQRRMGQSLGTGIDLPSPTHLQSVFGQSPDPFVTFPP